MSDHIKLRRDTAANWTSVNPVLESGEAGLETDTRKFKVGDGTTHWSSLQYWGATASVPTGTGFRHVTSGAEDAVSKLVENADVAAAAAIAESKLALNNPTHSSANDPSAGEKAALPGTNGTPGAGNKYVTDSDSRNTNSRTPTAHGHAESDITNLVTDLAGKAASSHNHAGADINSGTLDGDRLPALSSTKKGGVPATGTPSGKYLKDDATWDTPSGGGGGFQFPVGYVLISKVDTNPATFLGYGTWAKFGAGRVLVGLDSGDADFDAIGDTPGSKTSTPSAHAGTAVGNHAAAATGAASAGATQRGTTTSTLTLASHTHQTPLLSHSVTQPDNHSAMSIVQPSFVCYFWERTA